MDRDEHLVWMAEKEQLDKDEAINAEKHKKAVEARKEQEKAYLKSVKVPVWNDTEKINPNPDIHKKIIIQSRGMARPAVWDPLRGAYSFTDTRYIDVVSIPYIRYWCPFPTPVEPKELYEVEHA